jgi:hypothetical protein
MADLEPKDSSKGGSDTEKPTASYVTHEEILPVLEHMAALHQMHAQNHEQLHDTVHNGIIGGLKKGYKEDQVTQFRSKHGGKLGGIVKTISGAVGEDENNGWNLMHDKLEEHLKNGGNEDEFVDRLHDHLQKWREDMMNKLKDDQPEAEAAEPPDAGADVGSGTAKGAIENAKPLVQDNAKESGDKPAKVEKTSKAAVGSKEWFEKGKGPKKPSHSSK